MSAFVRWDPSKLNEALLRAFKSSVTNAKMVAIARSPAPGKAGASYTTLGPTTARLRATGLGTIFEGGRQGGYVIQPGLRTTRRRVPGGHGAKVASGVRAGSGNIALKFTKGDGGFARGGIIGGAMKARPYIHPAASAWAQELYQRRAQMAILQWSRLF